MNGLTNKKIAALLTLSVLTTACGGGGGGGGDGGGGDGGGGEPPVTTQPTTTTPDVSIADLSVTEGNDGLTPALLTVQLSAASSSAITVDYATVAGTATAGADFEAQTDILTFAAGETSKTITVNIVADSQYLGEEGDESFIVRLSNASGANISDNEATVTITNDDLLSRDQAYHQLQKTLTDQITGLRASNGIVETRAVELDLGADGDLDMLLFVKTADGADHNIWIYENLGGAGFVTSQTTISAKFFSNTAVADFSGDGRDDLVLTYDSATPVLLVQDSSGKLALNGGSLPAPANVRGVCAGDLDQDSNIDLVWLTASNIKAYSNSGAASFTDASADWLKVDTLFGGTPAASFSSCLVSDMTGDDRPDILLGDANDETATDLKGSLIGKSHALLRNDGSNSYGYDIADLIAAANNKTAQPDISLELVAANFDGDSCRDFAVLSTDSAAINSDLNIYISDCNGNFTLVASYNQWSSAVFPAQLHGGDADGDGSYDLLSYYKDPAVNTAIDKTDSSARFYAGGADGSFSDQVLTPEQRVTLSPLQFLGFNF